MEEREVERNSRRLERARRIEERGKESMVGNSEKLRKYKFEEVGEYRRISEDTIEVENRKEKFFPAIYAVVIENTVKNIGSTTQRGGKRRLTLRPGKHKIVKGVLIRKIFEELKSHKRAKLYYLTPLCARARFKIQTLCSSWRKPFC